MNTALQAALLVAVVAGALGPGRAVAMPGTAQPAPAPGPHLQLDPAHCARTVPQVQADAAALVALEPMALLGALLCRADGLQQADAQRQQANARVAQARANGRPQLAAVAGGERAAGLTAERSATLQASWTVLDFGATAASVRAAQQALAASRQEQGQALLAALDLAAQRLADAAAAQGRLEAAGTSLQAAAQAERVASGRQAAGAGSPVDAVQAQRLLAQARLEFVQAQGQRRQAALALGSALGLASDQAPRLALAAATQEALARADQTTPLDPRAASAAHPQARAALARVAQQQDQLQAVAAQRWGEVQLQARAGRLRSGDLPSTDQALGLSWRLPLVDGGLRSSRADEGRAALAAALADSADLQRQLALNMAQAQAALETSAQALRAAESLRDRAEAGWRLVDERWRRGVGSHLDLQSAQEAAALARQLVADAQAQLLLARWRLVATGADTPGLAALAQR